MHGIKKDLACWVFFFKRFKFLIIDCNLPKVTIKYNILIKTIITDIIPHTKGAISKGNKIFGAAILNKSDYSLVCIGTNNEIENPLWHGEISALKNFYDIPSNARPDSRDCIFLSTHEPCSLCLSAITWTGFDNFYYFFPYYETKNKFNIPHDLKILKEVFKINEGNYNKKNSFWESYSIIENINLMKGSERSKLDQEVKKIIEIYSDFSELYQKFKSNNNIPLN